MPLLPVILKTELSKVMDSNDPLFKKYPDTQLSSIWNFAGAINNYLLGIVPPSINTTLIIPLATIPVAEQIFIINMMTLSSVKGFTFMDLFPKALTQYAISIGIGMAPAFVGTAPVIPINMEPVWQIGMSGSSTQDVIEIMATTIDLWFKTGIAVNTVTGATITWI